jgi:hypothetical protein
MTNYSERLSAAQSAENNLYNFSMKLNTGTVPVRIKNDQVFFSAGKVKN